MEENQQLFSYSQARERWGGHPSEATIKRLVARGELEIVRVGARVFLPLREVRRVEMFGVGNGRSSQKQTANKAAR
jgi:hypothetical protein